MQQFVAFPIPCYDVPHHFCFFVWKPKSATCVSSPHVIARNFTRHPCPCAILASATLGFLRPSLLSKSSCAGLVARKACGNAFANWWWEKFVFSIACARQRWIMLGPDTSCSTDGRPMRATATKRDSCRSMDWQEWRPSSGQRPIWRCSISLSLTRTFTPSLISGAVRILERHHDCH